MPEFPGKKRANRRKSPVFPGFFGIRGDLEPENPQKTPLSPKERHSFTWSAGGRNQTASLRVLGSNDIRNRPVAEIIPTLKPAPA
jgi:hypothetical protein